MTAYSAGIFIADDKIIYGVAPSIGYGPADFSSLSIDRTSATNSIEHDIRHVLSRINQIIENHLHGSELDVNATSNDGVVSLVIAAPGPVLRSGRRTDIHHEMYGHFSDRNRVPQLRGKNLRDIAHNCLSKIKKSQFNDHCHIYVYHDAAAYAYGSYCLYLQEIVGEKSLQTVLDEHALNHVHLHLLVDEGVGGAIIANGGVAQNDMHPELGHMFVPHHPDDHYQIPVCVAHGERGCLESYVSLFALRKRFGENFLDNYAERDETDDGLALIAYYLANLICNLTLTISPSTVGLSGRTVTGNPRLVALVRGYIVQKLRIEPGSDKLYPGYPRQSARDFVYVEKEIDAGLYGCVTLARRSLVRDGNAPEASNVLSAKKTKKS